MKLSEAERSALELLVRSGGSILTSSIPDKNEKDVVFGTIEAGIKVYMKLETRGLVMITEEDPFELEDGVEFQFTNEIYITDEGRTALV